MVVQGDLLGWLRLKLHIAQLLHQELGYVQGLEGSRHLKYLVVVVDAGRAPHHYAFGLEAFEVLDRVCAHCFA